MRTQLMDKIQESEKQVPPDSKSYSNLIVDVLTTRTVKINIYSL